MTNLRQRMSEDLELRGLSANTRRAYLGAVKQLAKYYHKPPDQITEAELRTYLLHLKTEKKVAQSTFTVYLSGLKFFYETTLKRAWPTLELARSRREKKLPVVLSIAEVGRILGCVQNLRYQVCLSTIYACGLRISEGVRLRVEDVDSERMQLYVRNSKGGKDRTVPLSEKWAYENHGILACHVLACSISPLPLRSTCSEFLIGFPVIGRLRPRFLPLWL